MGLYVTSDVTGRDPSLWTVEGWLYDNIFYETTEAFVSAYWAGKVRKLPAPIDGAWGHTDSRGEGLPMDANYPPTAIAPSGSRFVVDYEHKYVE
jgi:primary-amine oxidase